MRQWSRAAASADAAGIELTSASSCAGETHHIDNRRGRSVVLELRFIAHQRQQGFAAG